MTVVIQINKLQAASFDKLNNLLEKWGSHYNFLNQILSNAITSGGIFQHNIACRLLKAYAKLNKLAEARKVFDGMPNPDVGSWTSLQNLYLNIKQPMKALMLFSRLVSSDFAKPDCHSVVAALSACARCKDLNNGRIIHGMVYKCLETLRPNVHNALIDMYGKNERVDLAERVFSSINFKDVAIWTSLLNGYLLNGDIESAKGVFDEMPQRNVVSWTSMIVGYVRKKNPIEALQLFTKMRNQDVEGHCNPTTVTIVALLSGCADIGALNLGGSIHGYINKRIGFLLDVTVNNALIDMYGKSGSLDSAVKLFDSMRKKDLFSWTSMISSLALNGRGKHALMVFNSMVEAGMAPNKVTFLSVLSACSHAGLVIEGERLFETFVTNYHMKPHIEHYGCMVDLFVRAGCLEKAIRLIEGMPMKPDAVIWRSLLGACLEHGNLELAEVAGKKVLELEPDDDAVYILLWSVYRSKNRWEDALRAMKMMRDQRIKKTPGCSWIEVNGVVLEFLAEAPGHHINDSILIVLNGMIKQSKNLIAEAAQSDWGSRLLKRTRNLDAKSYPGLSSKQPTHLSLCFILLSIFYINSSLSAAAQKPSPVLDIAGNELRAGTDYYILPVIRGRGGGLTLDSIGNRTCPLDVVQEQLEVENGLPLTFNPVNSTEDIVRVSTDQNIIFSASSICVQTTVWTLYFDESIGRYFVTTGGVAGNPGRETIRTWFKIEEYEGHYRFVYCPSVCDTCRVVCGEVVIFLQDGKRRLSLSLTDVPFMVMFRKA
ncbi:hypothetical protein BUALT_Bualt07G0002700 [Buddleja alternifolia]|uniref:Pentatricopeptide repeat-containing protein n=1 Tax=Buddleja alternifolia TaxID=168488 RepID=A0AAV6X7W6_9LAMI|nr:hypothetical protein BUALT_Bualt07G0002700 [Buddleja alternifolia]